MRPTVFVFVLLCIALGVCQRTFLDEGDNLQLYRFLRALSVDLVGRTGTEERLLREARILDKVQTRLPDDAPFPCNVTGWRSDEVPKSVHQLKVGDIDVIAAMGDSLTAGAGALGSNFLHVAVENRGTSATGGGQDTWREYLTLPNIFKEFNPNLIGYASGDSLSIQKESQLNVAESGAMSEDMPFMAKALVERMRNDPRVDIQRHWKFISIMIGSNDFCSNMCWKRWPWSVLKDHHDDMVQVLKILKENLPRTFVSLIIAPNLKVLVDAREERSIPYCNLLVSVECPCLFGLKYRRQREEFFDIMSKWQQLEMKIARYPEFQTEDFAVVAQPVLMNVSFPKAADGLIDMAYFSPDCFHISQKTNARYANALWNSLLLRENEKPTTWDEPFNVFLCPTTESPYLMTYKNSKKRKNQI